jgi:D-alanyl-D-alanine carboxypeptidase
VVFGSRNANERTLKAAELFDRGFASSPGLFAPTLASLPSSAAAAPLNLRPVICERSGTMPGEDDSPNGENLTAAAAAGMPNLMGATTALAFAGGATPPAPRTVLGPRAPLRPIPVWVGRTPPAVATAAAEADEPASAPAPRVRQPRPAVAAVGEPPVAAPPAAPAPARAARPPAPKPAAAKPAAPKPAPKAQAAVETKPKPAAATPAPKKPEAKPAAAAKPEPKRAEARADSKPAPKAEAKPAAKPAAAKPAPKAAAKPKAED